MSESNEPRISHSLRLLRDERTAVEEEIARLSRCEPGEAVAARVLQLSGMHDVLVWLLDGFEVQTPPSIQIGAWRAADERNGF